MCLKNGTRPFSALEEFRNKRSSNISKKYFIPPPEPESYGCCRHIPYKGVRKERNWFYFYIHDSRTDKPKSQSSRVLDKAFYKHGPRCEPCELRPPLLIVKR